MPAVTEVRIRNQAGAYVAVFDQWLELSLSDEVDATGAFAFHVGGNDARAAFLTYDSILEVWMKDDAAGIVWHRDWAGFIGDPDVYDDEDGAPHVIVSGRGLNDLLDRTDVRAFAGTAGSEKAGAAETVIKEYVYEQAGPGAGVRARPGLTIEADAATGNTVRLQRSYRNLLTVCQDVAAIGGGDFDIVQTDAILRNGDFEALGAGGADVFADWQEYSPGVPVPVDEMVDVYQGSHAVKLEFAGANPSAVWQDIPVYPGASFDLSFMTHGDGTVAGAYYVWDETNAAWIVAPVSTGVTGTGYQHVLITVTAPAGCYLLAVGMNSPLVNGIAWFDNVVLKPNGATGQMFVFRWHPGQLGTDRRSTVIFSTAFGNMAEPRLTTHNAQVRNSAYVVGQGTGAGRDWRLREEAGSIALSPWGRRETIVDAREVPLGDTAALDDKGDTALAENKATQSFTFKVLQSPGCVYGKDYFLGDLVTARFRGVDYDKKIVRQDYSNTPDGESRTVEVIDI
jgi:hypothetical protein